MTRERERELSLVNHKCKIIFPVCPNIEIYMSVRPVVSLQGRLGLYL